MAVEFTPEPCPICGESRPLDHELQVRWRTADWNAAQSRDQQDTHDRWLPVCAECQSAATTFRVTYPLDVRQHEQRLWRLVVSFGITLVLLVTVLFAGKSLVNSDPLMLKLLYAAGWCVVALGVIITCWLLSKTVSFELSARKDWSGPWIEKRLIAALQLPTGDRAPYWSQVDLLASCATRKRTPPIDPNAPVTITVVMG